jgi:hypothetical protein
MEYEKPACRSGREVKSLNKPVIFISLLLFGGTSLLSPEVESKEVKGMIRFEDLRDESGIDFKHYMNPELRGVATDNVLIIGMERVVKDGKEFWRSSPVQGRPRGRLMTIEEFAHIHLIWTTASGAAWLDYNRDGDWDIFMSNYKWKTPSVTNALFENMGKGEFIRRTSACGVNDSGEGMGVSTGDYDNDGYTDLFLTNYGNFVLYRNNGDGTFSDVTENAFSVSGGVKNWWYGGSAWGDYDRDGDLDLYVAGYVDLSKPRKKTNPLFFPPDFDGFPNTLYRNNGDGTFSNVTEKAGVGDMPWKTLQVVFCDFNEDNWPDIFLTNDTDPNSVYINRGDGTFINFSEQSGVNVPYGSMGIAVGDCNRDGKIDLIFTNYATEENVIGLLVDNESSLEGGVRNVVFTRDQNSPFLHKMSLPMVGWGAGLYDLENDGDLDLFFSNGHLNAPSGDNRSLNLLFENDGDGHFFDISESSGIWASGKRNHRSALFGDYDDDGKVDIYVVNIGLYTFDENWNVINDPNQGAGVLYHNISQADNNWLKIRLEGTVSNRDAYGSRVKVTVNDLVQVQPLISGTGFVSSNAKELYYGLGRNQEVDEIEVIWPNPIDPARGRDRENREGGLTKSLGPSYKWTGKREIFKKIKANQTVYIKEGDKLYENTRALATR